ncbi:branched-chain amino acid ABC transporter permease [Roseomonas sp. SSH11]|uniref:Branched-chain amino acid ABC transporter permease n=1 Tax=Pararoseomonas baculiformis TaxID=2820812 RepID=A0ABS4A9Y9_9PROT|nr:branched-chain amino acid ABC transporter permease [Pararoseomonas baculiformis]MBP0443810.1 branched-chain amino acid ABC transporter permease [Pararoseomonas baculiformis]
MNRVLKPAAVLLAAILVFLLPGWLGGVHGAFAVIAIMAVAAYGLDIVVSDLGEVSLAHTVFFAAGAYATGLLATRLGFGSWATLFGAIAVGTLIALALGLVTLSLREFVFSLVTYAATVVAAAIAHNWNVLGGSDGVSGIPTLDLSLGPVRLAATNDAELWPYAFALLLIALYAIRQFRRSRLGAMAMMVHLNPRLATMSGIDVRRVRLAVFVLSAPFSAAAGWLYAYQRAYIGPDLFETYFLVLMLTAVVLVGRRRLFGPLIGTALVVGQERFLSFGGDVNAIILGGALVTALALLPGGLDGLFRRLVTRPTTPAPVPEARPLAQP